jgi:hypothetical protein
VSFAKGIKTFTVKTKDLTDEVVREVVYQIATRVIQRSPVDTGLFRGSWRYSLGAPSMGIPKTMDKKGFLTIGNISRAMPQKMVGYVHHITNNQLYGLPLEMGSSRQAPMGMVGITVKEFQQIVNTAAKTVKEPA